MLGRRSWCALATATPFLRHMDCEGPIQIVGVDPKTSSVFLNRPQLEYALSAVPPGMKVACVSVVGEFRTGKSFLLDLFLRYLRAGAPAGEDESWLQLGGDELEGNANRNSPDFVVAPRGAAEGEAAEGASGLLGGGSQLPQAAAAAAKAAYAGFKWRAGNDRQTLGIWLWNKPFILPLPGSSGEEKVAVLLMDTQGLFDTLTNTALTAQIFGLSTLISSYQVYNVKERVSEKVLDSVSTFSAYARTAADLKEAPAPRPPRSSSAARGGGGGGGGGSSISIGSIRRRKGGVREVSREPVADGSAPVFQRLEFLVRDFKLPNPADFLDAGKADALMGAYFQGLFDQSPGGERGGETAKELRETRTQILSCFSAVSGFCLPSPGEIVTGDADVAFTGRVSEIRDKFRTALSRYVRIVFTQQLEAKRMFLGDGDEVTATEFTGFVEACATVFQDSEGKAQLPDIPMLLTATASSNTRAAKDRAVAHVREILRVYSAPGAVFVDPPKLQEALEAYVQQGLALFDKKANFGAREAIQLARAALQAELKDLVDGASELNAAREPKLAEWMLLLILWILLTLVQNLLDYTCAPWLGLCSSASSASGFFRMLLILLIPFALYFGKIPAFVSAMLKEMVALARAHSASLPQPVQDFLNGPLLGGGGSGGAMAATLTAAATSAAASAYSTAAAAATAASSAAAAPAPAAEYKMESSSGKATSSSIAYQGGAVRRANARE